MNKDDRNKLVKAGFTILRVSETPSLCIRQMTEEHSWSIMEKFNTKTAMYVAIKAINEHEPKMIFE